MPASVQGEVRTRQTLHTVFTQSASARAGPKKPWPTTSSSLRGQKSYVRPRPSREKDPKRLGKWRTKNESETLAGGGHPSRGRLRREVPASGVCCGLGSSHPRPGRCRISRPERVLCPYVRDSGNAQSPLCRPPESRGSRRGTGRQAENLLWWRQNTHDACTLPPPWWGERPQPPGIPGPLAGDQNGKSSKVQDRGARRFGIGSHEAAEKPALEGDGPDTLGRDGGT